MSDTPRTDEQIRNQVIQSVQVTNASPSVEIVNASFVRELERELTAALKDAERYRWLRENVNWSSNLKERMYYLKTVKNYTSLDDAIDSEITKEKS